MILFYRPILHISGRLIPLGYFVRGVYQLLAFQESYTLNAVADLIWHNHVSLKVFIFVWRLFRDRLPTKANLVWKLIHIPHIHCLTILKDSSKAINKLQSLSRAFRIVLFRLSLLRCCDLRWYTKRETPLHPSSLWATMESPKWTMKTSNMSRSHWTMQNCPSIYYTIQKINEKPKIKRFLKICLVEEFQLTLCGHEWIDEKSVVMWW